MVDFPLLVFVVSFGVLVFAAWVGDFLRKRSSSVPAVHESLSPSGDKLEQVVVPWSEIDIQAR